MSFKTIFIIFNTIILASFLVIFLLPIFYLGLDFFPNFIKSNWIALIIFSIFMLGFNFYFISNWKLFSLLEKENWLILIDFLENNIFKKNKIQKKYIKILINTYILTNKIKSIQALAEFIAANKAELLVHYPIEFGIPYLFSEEHKKAEEYFNGLLKIEKIKNREWISWNYAFALMKQNKTEEASVLFIR